jgi:hypothetical protein
VLEDAAEAHGQNGVDAGEALAGRSRADAGLGPQTVRATNACVQRTAMLDPR